MKTREPWLDGLKVTDSEQYDGRCSCCLALGAVRAHSVHPCTPGHLAWLGSWSLALCSSCRANVLASLRKIIARREKAEKSGNTYRLPKEARHVDVA